MHSLDFRKPYELIVLATPEDIDALGHVNNTVYLRWVQEVAIAHWRTIATPKQQAELVWMVLRHEIDYQAPARVHEQILLKTWIGTAAGLRFSRYTEIMNIERQLLATAKTIWCPVDPITQRPKKTSRDVRKMFSVEE